MAMHTPPDARARDSMGRFAAARGSTDAAAVARLTIRERQRMVGALSTMLSSRGYEAATSSRLRRDYHTAASGSADHMAGEAREPLIRFGRYMHRNDEAFRGVVRALVARSVGEGLYPQGQNPTARLASALFWDFAWNGKRADIRRRADFGRLQRLALREVLVAGDILPVRIDVGDGVAVQMIEAERIGSMARAMIDKTESGARIVDGVELEPGTDADAAYHVTRWDDVTGSSLTWTTERIAATEATLLAVRDEEAGLTRGIPPLASSLDRLAGLREYMASVSMAALIQAMLALVTKSDSPEAMRRATGTGTETMTGGGDEDIAGGGGNRTTRTVSGMQPGTVFDMPMGSEVEPLSSTQPSATLEMYAQVSLRLACGGAGVPLEQALGDYSKANFSVARMSLSFVEEVVRPLRMLIERDLCAPVYAGFVRRLARRGITLDIAEAMDVRWIGPPMPSLDPAAEAMAAATRIAFNLSTLHDELDALNRDYRGTIDQRIREVKEMRENGVPMPLPSTAVLPKPEAQADTAAPGNGDKDAGGG